MTQLKNYSLMIFFALAGLMLAGCGGGGGGGSSSVTPITPAPEITPVTPAPELGDSSPIAQKVAGPQGTYTTYISVAEGSSTLMINSNAVVNHYSSQYRSGDTVKKAGEEFLAFRPGNGGVERRGGRRAVYSIMRNTADGGDSPPDIFGYYLAPDATEATVEFVDKNIGRSSKISAGTAVVVTLAGGDTPTLLTMEVQDDELRFGSSATLKVPNNLEYAAYQGQSPRDSRPLYHHFLSAEYAALYMWNDRGDSDNSALGSLWSYGALTDYSEILTIGGVFYDLTAIGNYREEDSANDRFLHGSGNLKADFEAGRLALNLDIKDHNGADFMKVSNMDMYLHYDGNQFSTFNCDGDVGTTTPEEWACKGSITYPGTDVLPDVDMTAGTGYIGNEQGFWANGSFYGPNAEEVAGGVYHGRNNAALRLGFIGKQDSSGVTPVTPAPKAGDSSPIARKVAGPQSTHTTYIPVAEGSSTLFINNNAVVNHYSSQYRSGDTVKKAGEEFLIFAAGNGGVLSDNTGRRASYWVLRNSDDGNTAPLFALYSLAPDGTRATVSYTEPFGNRTIAAGEQFVVTLKTEDTGAGTAAELLTMRVEANELRLGTSDGSSTLEIADGYEYQLYSDSDYCNAYDPSPCGTQIEGLQTYSHFIKAEYAALYLFQYGSENANSDSGAFRYARSYGALTDYADIPTTGNVSYKIDHAIGNYREFNAHENDRFLHGSGSLVADFEAGRLALDLDIKDHNGADFMMVRDLEMQLSPDRNQFHTYNCHGNPPANSGAVECRGTVEYVPDDVLLPDLDLTDNSLDNISREGFDAAGSFYGPDAEEVAGGIWHQKEGVDANISIGFIGKQE